MIWIAAMALAFVFIKLGMLIILVKLLTIALQLALLVVAGFTIIFIWHKVFGQKLRIYKMNQSKRIISNGK